MAHPGAIGSAAPPNEAGLMRRIEDIERWQREALPAFMATLGPLFAEIAAAAAAAQAAADAAQDAADAAAAAVADLAVQVARIDTLVNQQVTFGIAGTATSSGWSSSTGMTTKASSSIAVPAGYSQALVFALASMHFMDSAPNGGWVQAVIAGDAGGEMGGLANLQLGQSASHTRVMAVAGGSIGIECQMRSSVATGGMSGRIAQVSGFALFLR
jgi:hypothetical protein